MAANVRQIKASNEFLKLAEYSQNLAKQVRTTKGIDPELLREWTLTKSTCEQYLQAPAPKEPAKVS